VLTCNTVQHNAQCDGRWLNTWLQEVCKLQITNSKKWQRKKATYTCRIFCDYKYSAQYPYAECLDVNNVQKITNRLQKTRYRRYRSKQSPESDTTNYHNGWTQTKYEMVCNYQQTTISGNLLVSTRVDSYRTASLWVQPSSTLKTLGVILDKQLSSHSTST